ncbi:hypothetical protein [Pseudomonas phage D6]|nr:hypothetical protein [Pseudomonas phage D6]
MDFFDRFDNVLKNNFHGDFSAMVNAEHRFDYYPGVDGPVRINEIDRRKTKENGYITTPDVQLSDEPVVEPVVAEPPVQSEIDFKVIDLDTEMDKRRKNTEPDNPVQPEPQDAVSDDIPKPATKKSSRRVASPAKASKATKAPKAEGGNRQQRRAAEATGRKGGKTGNKSPRKNGNRDSGSTQEAETPEKVNLSDLGFGFRLE